MSKVDDSSTSTTTTTTTTTMDLPSLPSISSIARGSSIVDISLVLKHLSSPLRMAALNASELLYYLAEKSPDLITPYSAQILECTVPSKMLAKTLLNLAKVLKITTALDKDFSEQNLENFIQLARSLVQDDSLWTNALDSKHASIIIEIIRENLKNINLDQVNKLIDVLFSCFSKPEPNVQLAAGLCIRELLEQKHELLNGQVHRLLRQVHLLPSSAIPSIHCLQLANPDVFATNFHKVIELYKNAAAPNDIPILQCICVVSQSTPLLLLPHAAVIVSGVSSRTGSGSTRTTLLGLACLKALATYKPPAILPFIDTLMGLTNSGHKQELFQALTPIASSINSPDTVSLVDFDTSSSSNTINGVDHSHLAGPEGVITHFSHNNSNNNNSNKINSNNNNLAELHYSVSSLLHISGSSGLSSSTSSSAPLVVLANLVCFLAKSNTLLFEKVLSWLNDILKPQLQHLVLAPSVDSISVTSLNSIVALLTELKEFGSENIELFSRYKDLLESFANINIPAIREVAVQGLDIIDEFLLRDIAKWINEENAKLKKLATSFTALKNGIENDVIEAYISELKTRIPIPIKFASEGDSVNMLRLYFVCKRHCIGCFYPQSRAFCIVTKEYKEWLKIAFCLLKLGKCSLDIHNAGNNIDAIEVAFNRAADFHPSEKFLDFIGTPFLTLDEQNTLIMQLKQAGFPDTFQFHPKNDGWVCQFCSTAAANAPIQVERYLPSDVIVESPSPSRSRKLSRQVSSTFENNSSNGNGNNTNNELNRSAQFVISTVNSAPNSPAKSLRLNTSTISTVSTNSTANGYVSLADSLAEKGTFIRMRTRQAPPNWQIDTKISACNICKQTFGLTLRRHHCRYCGKIFCSTCSDFFLSIPEFGPQYLEPVRICSNCHGILIMEPFSGITTASTSEPTSPLLSSSSFRYNKNFLLVEGKKMYSVLFEGLLFCFPSYLPNAVAVKSIPLLNISHVEPSQTAIKLKFTDHSTLTLELANDAVADHTSHTSTFTNNASSINEWAQDIIVNRKIQLSGGAEMHRLSAPIILSNVLNLISEIERKQRSK